MWSKLASRLGLSPRELCLVQGVFDELTNREIAARCNIASGTVGVHFARLHKKLGVKTRAGVVRAVIQAYLQLPESQQEIQEVP
jgi:DNA-binding NarL/FixJ family response regulator